MFLRELIQKVHSFNQEIAETIEDSCIVVTSEQLGLDRRCGFSFLNITGGYIAVPSQNNKEYRYYAGFEYIDDYDVQQIGEYFVYSVDSERIQECVDEFLYQEQEEIQEE
jgi:hypothetical protein